jgi:hypothetical protein
MGHGHSARTIAETEILRREMMAAGERLLQALATERLFFRLDPDDETSEIIALWKECRKIVDEFSDDYAMTTARWRLSAEREGIQSRERPIAAPARVATTARTEIVPVMEGCSIVAQWWGHRLK